MTFGGSKVRQNNETKTTLVFYSCGEQNQSSNRWTIMKFHWQRMDTKIPKNITEKKKKNPQILNSLGGNIVNILNMIKHHEQFKHWQKKNHWTVCYATNGSTEFYVIGL